MVGSPTGIRDQQKRDACEDYGITLLEIPYWWDNTIESLSAFIHKVIPNFIYLYIYLYVHLYLYLL